MRSDARILISDDDRNIQTALHLLLKTAGLRCAPAFSPEETLAALDSERFSLLLMDLNFQRDTTSGGEGLTLLRQVRERWPDLPVVVMTAWGSIDLAVAAMRLNASDFIEKPWDNARLLDMVRTLANTPPAAQPNNAGAAVGTRNAPAIRWIAESQAMSRVMEIVDQVATSDINILLTGENGTGKTQLASLIHERSPRAAHAFVSLNMSAIPDSLFESELYGHVKGAFTDARTSRRGRFEMADSGTLFMDEIGELPLQQQSKLLHVLESRRYEKLGSSETVQADVRVVSATNAHLPTLIAQGRFRQDLLYRLRGFEIRVPALRERREDIAPLAIQYARHFAEKYGRPTPDFEPRAIGMLEHHDWPGNVRELSHLIERAVLLNRKTVLRAEDLDLTHTTPNRPDMHAASHVAVPFAGSVAGDHAMHRGEPAAGWSELTLQDAEKQMLQSALRRHGGNASAAARALGLSRSAFYRRLEKYDC